MKYFGTDGIRATVGESFLNEEFAFALWYALGKFIEMNSQIGSDVLIGRDTCHLGKAFSRLSSKLARCGIKGVSVGIVPTPALAFGVIEKKMIMGVMITASHNPVQDNGLNFLKTMVQNLTSPKSL